MDLLQCLMDSSSHAIFTLDRDGIITHINQQAKVRFGLYHNSQHPHPAGRLKPHPPHHETKGPPTRQDTH